MIMIEEIAKNNLFFYRQNYFGFVQVCSWEFQVVACNDSSNKDFYILEYEFFIYVVHFGLSVIAKQ